MPRNYKNSENDGSRASYPDDDGTEFGFGPPEPGREDDYRKGIDLARTILSQGSEVVGAEDIPEQLVIPEVEESVPSREKRKTGKVAFGRFLKPEIYDPEGFYDAISISEKTKNWFSVERLEDFAFNSEKKEGFERSVVNGVLLTPRERSIIPGSPKDYAERSVDRTLAADDITNERIEAAERSKIHTLDNLIERLETQQVGLSHRLEDIRILKKEASQPGYAHVDEGKMKQLINSSWQELLNLIETLQVNKGWTDEERIQIEKSAFIYLSTGSQRDRVGKWQKLLAFQDNHLNARNKLFILKIRDCKRELTSTSN